MVLCVYSTWAVPHIELLYLLMDIALWKVLNVGELQIEVGQPHLQTFPGPFKFLPLTGEILWKKKAKQFITSSSESLTLNQLVNLK